MYTGIHQRQLWTRRRGAPHARKYFPFRNLEGTHAELSLQNARKFRWCAAPYAIAVALARRGDDWMRNLRVEFSAFWRESCRRFVGNSLHMREKRQTVFAANVKTRTYLAYSEWVRKVFEKLTSYAKGCECVCIKQNGMRKNAYTYYLVLHSKVIFLHSLWCDIDQNGIMTSLIILSRYFEFL